MFIVLEGLDGAGKTTLRNLISLALGDQGYEVVLTHEPGGTPMAEYLRDLHKFGSKKFEEAMTEEARLCILTASRCQHVREVIKPKLAQGAVVLSDRFFWSTLAYTTDYCYDTALTMHRALGNDVKPDLILYLDIDHVTSLERRGLRQSAQWDNLLSDEDRKECDAETIIDQRFESARLVYQDLAATEPNAVTLDARLPTSTLFAKAMEAIGTVQARLNQNESKRTVTSETDHAGRVGNSAQ